MKKVFMDVEDAARGMIAPKLMAYDLYMRRVPKAEILEIVGIDEHTLNHWITSQGWYRKRAELEQEAIERSNMSYVEFVTENREAVAREQLSRFHSLDKVIKRHIEEEALVEKLSPREINMLADALKKNSDVASRILGIHEQAVSNLVQPQEDEFKSSRRLIMEINPILPMQEVKELPEGEKKTPF